MIVHLPLDALPGGPLLMYGTAARDTAPTEVTLSTLGEGGWSADVTGLVSRWWPTVEYTIGTEPYRLDLPYVDLPEDPQLVVTPESVLKSAGIPLPVTVDQREIAVEAILDAQADVVAHLGRAIVPTVYTESGRYDDGRGRWNLTPLDEPVIEVLTVTADTSYGQPTGYFTITYRAGLNAKDDPELRPIRRYVTAAAMNSPQFLRMWRVATSARGEIKSTTTEGQSVTYDSATLGGGGQGQAGALPTLKSLDRWRIAGREVFQRRTRPRPPWPYTGVSGDGVYW
jgi:hypothetical protein